MRAALRSFSVRTAHKTGEDLKDGALVLAAVRHVMDSLVVVVEFAFFAVVEVDYEILYFVGYPQAFFAERPRLRKRGVAQNDLAYVRRYGVVFVDGVGFFPVAHRVAVFDFHGVLPVNGFSVGFSLYMRFVV